MSARLLACWFAAACAIIAFAGAPLAQGVKSDQEILMQLERDWDAALHRNDAKFIERLLADEFIATYDDGTRADKKRELEIAASFNQAVQASSLDQFTIRIYGDTAVVWFRLRMIGPKQGKPVELALHYTDVWVMRDGRWQCVSSQSTRINQASK
jgi:ketosteroid isomerase-like protein